MRISNMVVHPEPEFRSHAPLPDKVRYVFVGHFLAAKTGDHTEDLFFCLRHDLRCEDPPTAKGVVAVYDNDLFSLEIQLRERPQPAQAHGTGFDPLIAEQVDGN